MPQAVCGCVCTHTRSTLGSWYFAALSVFCISPRFCNSPTVCVLVCCVVCDLLRILCTAVHSSSTVCYQRSRCDIVQFRTSWSYRIGGATKKQERHDLIRFSHWYRSYRTGVRRKEKIEIIYKTIAPRCHRSHDLISEFTYFRLFLTGWFPFALENLTSRDRLGRPVPRQAVLTREIPSAFRDGVHLFIPSTAIGSVLNLIGHANAYRRCSLPIICRHRASSPQGSSKYG